MEISDIIIIETQSLSDAICPACSRDEAGERGEALFVLADAIKVMTDMSLLKPVTVAEVYSAVRVVLSKLPTSQRIGFSRRHLPALRALQKWANR